LLLGVAVAAIPSEGGGEKHTLINAGVFKAVFKAVFNHVPVLIEFYARTRVIFQSRRVLD